MIRNAFACIATRTVARTDSSSVIARSSSFRFATKPTPAMCPTGSGSGSAAGAANTTVVTSPGTCVGFFRRRRRGMDATAGTPSACTPTPAICTSGAVASDRSSDCGGETLKTRASRLSADTSEGCWASEMDSSGPEERTARRRFTCTTTPSRLMPGRFVMNPCTGEAERVAACCCSADPVSRSSVPDISQVDAVHGRDVSPHRRYPCCLRRVAADSHARLFPWGHRSISATSGQ